MAQTLPKVAGVEMNNQIRAEINTTPEAEIATYGDMTQAFKSIGVAINETIYNASYLSDGGFGSSAVVGAAPVLTLTGDYLKNDPVCQYLDGIQYEIGNKRVTDIKITRQGKVVSCPVTLTGVAIAGGESNAPNSITVTIAFNGKPTVTTSEG